MILLCLVFVALFLFYKWSIFTHDYFKERNIPFVKPIPLLGQVWSILTQNQHPVDIASEGYLKFPNTRVSGMFLLRTPTYLVHDPVLFKQMATKDFDHFADHVTQLSLEADPLMGRSLVFTNGSRWRHHRAGLTPAFTGSKMRSVFGLLSNSVAGATQRLLESSQAKPFTLELRDLYSRMGNDLMTSVSFGVEVDSLTDRNNEFFEMGKRLTRICGIPALKFFISIAMPDLFRFFQMGIMYKDVNEFYQNAVSKNIFLREQNNIIRPDFIHLLLQARKNMLKTEKFDKLEHFEFSTAKSHSVEIKDDVKIEWDDIEITGATGSFFFGGIETTTTLLCFASYELAVNPSIQARLRDEVDAACENLQDGRTPTYELLQKMKYMDMVVSETLRRWASFGMTNRKCTNDYTFTNYDGTQVTIEKGLNVWIPLNAFHLDEKYFPDPMCFNPERFADPASINQDAYVPFGIGLRNCIGSRFALMHAKCILFYMVSNFIIEPAEKLTIPIEIDTSCPGLYAKHGFWMNLVPRMPLRGTTDD